MAGRPAAKDKLRTLEEAKEYYSKIISVISDIESGESERASCAKHGITIISFRNDTFLVVAVFLCIESLYSM